MAVLCRRRSVRELSTGDRTHAASEVATDRLPVGVVAGILPSSYTNGDYINQDVVG